MTGGWFVGDFDQAAFRTKQVEVAYKKHSAGENWPEHYQKRAIEINLLVSGKMKLNGQEIRPGEIFVIDPLVKAKPRFYTDCAFVVVKIPSLPNDKVVTE